MTKTHQLYSSAIFVPILFTDLHPLFFLESFWTSPAGFPKAVNLLLFLGILFYLLRKPAREFFAKRLADVREILERAAREKEGAMARMAELDARFNRLDAELAEIKKQAQDEAVAERERVELETKRDIDKFRASAQREIESAKQIALADLREFAATKSVELAEQIIRRELSPEDDARLLQRVSDQLGSGK